jgi:hypothetical protein
MDSLWVAVPRPARGARLLAAAFAVVAVIAAQLVVAPADAATGTISGVVFQDLDRDAVRQAGEPGFGGHRLDLYTSAGTYVKYVDTASDGRFAFTGLADGAYEVRYRTSSWLAIREDWVPTTTGSLSPRQAVTVRNGAAVADIGWRPIAKSTDVNAPISTHTGPSGLKVQSYNDVLDARFLHDHIVSEFLVGAEAGATTIRFGYGTSSLTNTVSQTKDGAYTSFRATVYVAYASWLTGGDRTLAHEYGHAWGEYHTTIVQQDRTWAAYLQARGLAGDDRVGSSYQWLPTEIIAEDYRQLFASDNAARGGQMNTQIPLASEVPGLESWLRHDFRGGTAPEPEPEPTPTPEPEPTPEPTPEPEPVVPAAPIDLTVATAKIKGKNQAQLSWTGATSNQVDVYRDGSRLVTTTGSTYTDTGVAKGSHAHAYQVCEAGTDVCSDAVAVQF